MYSSQTLLPQEEPSPGQRGTLTSPPVVMGTTVHPVPTWSYCEAEMGGMVMMVTMVMMVVMECQALPAGMERMER